MTPNKVRKCIELSALLPRLLESDGEGHAPATILREQFGLLHEERGAIIRFAPRQGVMPIFSLYSRDATSSSKAPPLISILRQIGWPPEKVASGLADWLARPILSAVLSLPANLERPVTVLPEAVQEPLFEKAHSF